MRKDPTEFRKRFAAWKDGKQVYKDGLPAYRGGKQVLNNYTNAEFNDDGTFTDDTTKVFDDFYVTPSGVKTKYGSYTDKNWDRYKQQEQFFKTHDQQTGKLKYEPGLEIVSPEFDILTLGAGARTNAATQTFQKNRKIANAIAKGIKENAIITGYNRNPVTKELGTLWDYQNYLDNVFPNSKIKDVLWHGSAKKNLQSFSSEYIGSNAPIKKSVGMYLSPEKTTAANYGRKGDVYPVLLNTENPFITNQFFGGFSKNGINVTKISPKTRSTILVNNDAVIAPTRGEIAFFEPNNALVLGSKRDVEGFRRFMSSPQITAENSASATPVSREINPFKYNGSDFDFDTKDIFNKMRSFQIRRALSQTTSEGNDLAKDLYGGVDLSSDVVHYEGMPEKVENLFRHQILPRTNINPLDYDRTIGTLSRYGYNTLNNDAWVKYVDDNLAGYLDNTTNAIAIRDGYLDYAAAHEFRHRMQRMVPYKHSLAIDRPSYLNQAYGDEFIQLPKNVDPSDSLYGYTLMKDEAATTNLDARKWAFENLSDNTNIGNLSVKEQNEFLDNLSADDIIQAVVNSNAYGKKYIHFLEQKYHLLDNPRLNAMWANRFRNAMKYYGAASIPVTTAIKNTQNELRNK